jgi:hypothetical protein
MVVLQVMKIMCQDKNKKVSVICVCLCDKFMKHFYLQYLWIKLQCDLIEGLPLYLHAISLMDHQAGMNS